MSQAKRVRKECSALPKGWIREEVTRRTGISAGKTDIYYYSTAGRKVRSKPELIKAVGDTIDLTNFDFNLGRIVRPRTSAGAGSSGRPAARKNGKHTAGSILGEELAGRVNNSLLPPIRQTASIFKQPVTLVKEGPETVKKAELRSLRDKPRQLFWERRLCGLSAYSPLMENLPMCLPPGIHGLEGLGGAGREDSTGMLLASISTALHRDKTPIVGQTGKTEVLSSNPTAYINPDQPLIGSLELTDSAIAEQEKRVGRARERLAQAVKAIS